MQLLFSSNFIGDYLFKKITFYEISGSFMFGKSTELDKHTFTHILFNNNLYQYKHNKGNRNIQLQKIVRKIISQ